jgi:hypothetical protein
LSDNDSAEDINESGDDDDEKSSHSDEDEEEKEEDVSSDSGGEGRASDQNAISEDEIDYADRTELAENRNTSAESSNIVVDNTEHACQNEEQINVQDDEDEDEDVRIVGKKRKALRNKYDPKKARKRQIREYYNEGIVINLCVLEYAL